MDLNIKVASINIFIIGIHCKMLNVSIWSRTTAAFWKKFGRVVLVLSQRIGEIMYKLSSSWVLKNFTCKMGHTEASTQKIFSANFCY